jgi:YggT family protein
MALICTLLTAYQIVIFVRIIMSWIPPTPGTTYAQIFEFFDAITEPVLGPVRRMLPPVRLGMAALDLSPIVVIIGIILLQGALC